MNKFDLKTGKVIGYDHLRLGLNCQDALASEQFVLADGQYTVAIVSDGSTVGEDNPHLVHTEVGATLTCEFLLQKTEEYLTRNLYPPILPYFLYDDLLDYYHSLVLHKAKSNTSNLVDYVKHHLLCTILILVITPKYGLVMRYGDGLVVIDNQIFTFDYNDKPPYLAYHLIPKHLKIEATELPQSFDVIEFDPNKVSRIAIGSDAFVANQDLIPQFWGHKHPNQIQRNLNIWSKIDHKLLDDATLVVLEKKESS